MKVIYLTKDDELIQSVEAFIDEWHNDSDSIIVRTSGSTGVAKEILLSKKNMIASAIMTGKHFHLKEGESALLCLSPTTIAGKMMIVRSIVLNLILYVTDVSSSPLSLLKSSIQFAAMVPMQVEKSLLATPEKFQQIEKLIIGGAPINSQLEKQLSTISTKCFQTFGMTETISHIAVRKLEPESSEYQTLPGVEISVSDEETLVINAPELGVSKLITNDIVSISSSNSFKWLGRKDFIINTGGIKISPEEIEKSLHQLIQDPFFISSLPDDVLGEKVILCIQNDSIVGLSKNSFYPFITKRIVPKEIYYFSNLIYTHSNKIDRKATLKTINSAKKQVL